MSKTLSVIKVDEEKAEVALVTTLVGDPVHELAEITNADESLDISTNPAPLITIVCAIPLIIASTLGVNEVTEMMLKMPAAKYGDAVLHRTHN